MGNSDSSSDSSGCDDNSYGSDNDVDSNSHASDDADDYMDNYIDDVDSDAMEEELDHDNPGIVSTLTNNNIKPCIKEGGDATQKAMDNSTLQVSVETPDLLRLQTNAIEQATGALLPGSLHYEINSNNEKQVTGTIGLPGLPALENTYNFDTKETSTSVTIPHPICPLFNKTFDLSTNTDAGITTSFGIGPLSIETKEKYSDSSTYSSSVGMTTGNPVAAMLSKSIIDGKDDLFNLTK